MSDFFLSSKVDIFVSLSLSDNKKTSFSRFLVFTHNQTFVLWRIFGLENVFCQIRMLLKNVAKKRMNRAFFFKVSLRKKTITLTSWSQKQTKTLGLKKVLFYLVFSFIWKQQTKKKRFLVNVECPFSFSQALSSFYTKFLLTKVKVWENDRVI